MISKNSFYIYLLVLVFISLSCTTGKGTLGLINTIDTDINAAINGSSEIILKTRDGCSQTGFNLKKSFYDEERYNDNLFIASTYDDLKILQEKYFDLPNLNTLSQEYFEKNYLILILQSYTGGSELRNERIEIKDDKYSFIIEYWNLPQPGHFSGWRYSSCLYRVLYVLQIPKNESADSVVYRNDIASKNTVYGFKQ